ncbi:MAG TPA: signal peptidase II [Patescibacteria group bacterium]|nr:signal peptidase II [Patescibacteria group bacterium]
MPEQQLHKPGRFFAVAFVLILAVIAADQASKWYVLETMLRTNPENLDFWSWFTKRAPLAFFEDQQEKYKQVVFNGWLNFTMVWNKGISFGMFASQNGKMPVLFICVSLCISMALFFWLVLARTTLLFIALPPIIGGAIANVCDRVRFGAVADFIDLHIGEHHWPAFNIADACVVIGAALVVIDAILDKSDNKKDTANA